MNDIDWENIRCFLAVGTSGSLNRASERLGVSPATLGRRMLALERQLGLALFRRSQTGYHLSDDGRAFMELAMSMQATSRSIKDWINQHKRRPEVRISAGTWTSAFLCEHFSRLWSADDPFCISIVATERRLDIPHREIDIGLRNARPDDPALAGRKIGEMAIAAYCARAASVEAKSRWIGIAGDAEDRSSTRWLMGQPDADIAAWASTPRAQYDLMRAGVGKAIIPCLAGDRDPGLERASPVMEHLQQERWMVLHQEGRHVSFVRTVVDRLSELLEEHRDLFEGSRVLGKQNHHQD